MEIINGIIGFLGDNPRLIIGNFFGLVATVVAFMSYQAKTPKKLLFLQTLLVVTVIISYAILGAWTGMALNIVCFFRNLTYGAKNVRPFSYKAVPYIWAAVIGGIGALSWQGPISVLIIIALMINTVVLSLGDNKKLRLSILVTSTLVIIYNIYNLAYLAILMEAMCIISSVIALIRFRKRDT